VLCLLVFCDFDYYYVKGALKSDMSGHSVNA